MKKILISALLIVNMFAFSACGDEQEKASTNQTSVPSTTTITRPSTTESEYTKMDYYENIDVNKVIGVYPVCSVALKGDIEFPQCCDPTLSSVDMTAEHDGETIIVTLKMRNEYYFSQEYIDEYKIIPICREKKIEIPVDELDQLVYRKEQYTDEIDVAVTEAITKRFQEDNIEVEIAKKYLYVYDGEGEYGEVDVSWNPVTSNNNLLYDENGLFLCINNAGLRAICYSSEENRYYPVKVAMKLNKNELIDVYVDKRSYSYATIEECYEQLLDNKENMELIEYTK